jgi:hypothetical protein
VGVGAGQAAQVGTLAEADAGDEEAEGLRALGGLLGDGGAAAARTRLAAMRVVRFMRCFLGRL